jgi:uncharacterized DUF497 family protein
MSLPNFNDLVGFDWDNGNIEKNWKKHNVRAGEIEEIFFNDPLIVLQDDLHSDVEMRYMCLGMTNTTRKLFCVFTIREHKIRPISAREMTPRERKVYENS